MRQVGLLALKVGHVALRALHSTTAALDLYEQVIVPVTSNQEGVQPPPPDTPQMLPSVHTLWGALVGALRVSFALPCLPLGSFAHTPSVACMSKLMLHLQHFCIDCLLLAISLCYTNLVTSCRLNRPYSKRSASWHTKHAYCRITP